MSKIFLIVIIVTSSMMYSCSEKNTIPPKTSTDTVGLVMQTLLHDGVTRQYILYVPEVYDENIAVPLMLNFHGYGGLANEYIGYADMRSLADTENFILAYPQGTLLDGFSHWNSGLESEDNKSNTDDFGFTEAMIDQISTNYNIDLKRVYACGYSNGAFFSYSLACYLSHKITAIGSVAGTMMTETYDNCNPSHPTAMINIHGTSDNVVPYDGNMGLKSIDDVLNYWVTFNNTTMNPTLNSINDNGMTIDHYTYTQGDSNVSVDHYKINGGGHIWFDINYQGSNTSRLIWDFLSRYDHDGLRR